MVPADPVPVVLGKGMVVVVVPFSIGKQADEIAIDGGVFFTVVLGAPFMGERVDRPGG